MKFLKLVFSENFLLMIAVSFLLAFNSVDAQINQQWAKTYNGNGDFNDRITCLAYDNQGNIYAGGSTVNIGVNRDFLILKLDASGTVIWRAEYNAVGNGIDEVLAIWVDSSYQVYVTGLGKSANTGSDFLTNKYDANGNLLWSQMYDSPFHQYDQANSIAVDGNGDVIVTGQGDRDASAFTNDDYITVKYSSAGVFQWVQQFNGLGNDVDRAVKVVTDASNNIYVTGRSNNGSNDDYATFKYDANGTQQWLQYGDRGKTDRATAMCIDAIGNIYVTGWSSNGSNDDFMTIKYNSSGTSVFQKVYDNVDDDRAYAIGVDANSNFYITGASDNDASPNRNYDIRTIKYNAAGGIGWNMTYNGTASNDDIPNAIYVTDNGVVYVAGQTDSDPTQLVKNNMVTIKYLANGTQSWLDVYSGVAGNDDVANAVVLNSNGNCFSAGYTEDAAYQRNGIIIKYNTTGISLFDYIFNGVGDNSDNIRKIAIDNSHNIYVAGYSVGFLSDRDFTVIKYNQNGDTLWVRSNNGTSPGSDDEANSLVIDAQGNAIAGGFTKNSGTSNDYKLIKYNSNGDTVWTFQYDSPVHEADKSYDMVMDANGNFYMTGRTDNDPTINSNDDATTLKISSNGSLVWTANFNGTANGNERGSFVRVAPSGNVYVSGRTFNGTNEDIFVVKYNDAGVQQWIAFYDGGTGNDQPNAMRIDALESVYITGQSAGTVDTIMDFVTLKINASGAIEWTKRFDAAGGNDIALGIELDNSNNVIITGYADADASVDTNYNVVTIKYDIYGNVIWNQTYNGTQNLNDISDDIAIDAYNNVYVAAHTNNGTALDENYDVLVLRYNENGSLFWNSTYNGSADSIDVPNLILVKDNDVYVAGSSYQNPGQRDMLLVKFNGMLGVEDNLSLQADAVVMPNPCSDKIQVLLHNDSMRSFRVADVTGQTVFEKSELKLFETTFDLSQLTAGIYFYSIQTLQGKFINGKIIRN